MRQTKYNIPIYEDEDMADLKDYSEKMAEAIKTQIDKFGNPLNFKGSVLTLSDLQLITDNQNGDIYAVKEENKNYIWNGTDWVEYSDNMASQIPKNAGTHNSIYRGKDITTLFYNGTLSQQIANQTFDDIFIGDYIIGQTSGRKYLVADINYRLHMGNIECTTPHILMIPERILGTAKMNDTNITTGAYVGSKMYTEYLAPFKTVIQNDFEVGHILQHKNYFANAVTNGYESAGAWADSTIELMNEIMVYGSNIYHNVTNGTNLPTNVTIDKSQLSLFKLDKSKIVALNDAGERYWYWLRDVVSASSFAGVGTSGSAGSYTASNSGGVSPTFLIY